MCSQDILLQHSPLLASDLDYSHPVVNFLFAFGLNHCCGGFLASPLCYLFKLACCPDNSPIVGVLFRIMLFACSCSFPIWTVLERNCHLDRYLLLCFHFCVFMLRFLLSLLSVPFSFKLKTTQVEICCYVSPLP